MVITVRSDMPNIKESFEIIHREIYNNWNYHRAHAIILHCILEDHLRYFIKKYTGISNTKLEEKGIKTFCDFIEEGFKEKLYGEAIKNELITINLILSQLIFYGENER